MSAAWDELVALERDCKGCPDCLLAAWVILEDGYRGCGGSLQKPNKVALLPGLQVPCFIGSHGVDWFEGNQRPVSCSSIGCPGWQPAPRSPETLLVALREAGYHVEVGTWALDTSADPYYAGIVPDKDDDAGAEAYADSPLAALEEAALAALKAS